MARKNLPPFFDVMLLCVNLYQYEFGCRFKFNCYILLYITHISHTSLYLTYPIRSHNKKQFFPIICKKMISAISHCIFTTSLYAFFLNCKYNYKHSLEYSIPLSSISFFMSIFKYSFFEIF